MLSNEVEKLVDQALKEARDRRQEFATVEHLCLVLFDNARVMSILSQLGVGKKELKNRFLDFIDRQLERLPIGSKLETMPSMGFQRVLQRASIHVVGAGKEEVLAEHLLVAAFDEDESYAVFLMQQAGLTRLDLVSMIAHGDFSYPQELAADFEEDADDSYMGEGQESALSRFATCLTKEAKEGRLDQLIGREKELERIIQVLTRRRKNNPLLVGEPGVGKTALAEGLAIKICNGQVPKHLVDAKMYLLDLGSMLAGARYRGDFENRMKAVLKEIKDQGNAIMVIDEIHTIIGAGSTSGSSMDASNLLKPALANGQLRCIGSTTYKEYRTHFEKDRALVRRFQKIDVDEPSSQECVKILQGLRPRYEQFHGVKIVDEALSAAVSLSKRFLHEKKLPDKAIDLMDEACARKRLLKSLIDVAKKKEGPLIKVVDIEEALSSMANIPQRQVSSDDKKILSHLDKVLKAKVFGQDAAVTQICNSVIMARAGLRDKEKPIGSFLFTGPSGVGKTEVARQLAKALAIDLLRFDMSEYMERHSASRLVGAPPGYVGFDQGGLLTDAVTKSPYCVLLLDEIEKAHQDVFNMLLQVMDYGKLTDSNGRHADFRHAIIIMTSNVGAREMEQRSIGFSDEGEKATGSHKMDSAIKRLFSPEFRNRLDAVVAFEKLSMPVILNVVDKFIAELNDQLAEKSVFIKVSKGARLFLAKVGYDSAMGARPLKRIISERIKRPIAREILFGKLSLVGGKVSVELNKGALRLCYENQAVLAE